MNCDLNDWHHRKIELSADVNVLHGLNDIRYGHEECGGFDDNEIKVVK